MQAEARLEELRAALALTHGLEATAELRVGVTRIAIVEAAAVTDLLVLGARGTNPVIDTLLGTTATRVLRALRVPLLIMKQQASAAYGRVLAAVDFSRHATGSVARRTRANAPCDVLVVPAQAF